jgi:hypothetical protein
MFWTMSVGALGVPWAAFMGSILDDPKEPPRAGWTAFWLCLLLWTGIVAMIMFGQYGRLHSIVGWPN